MRNKPELQNPTGIQLELFQSTKRLNLSETYEAIPKEVSATDPNINWVNDDIANPIEKAFSIDGQTFVSEIIPATVKNKKTKTFQSRFPDFREARIEYAIISLASKQVIDIDTDNESNKIFILKTTYYKIQKEIVEAINKWEGKDLSPYDCPYNIPSIKEALEVLKMVTIEVKNEYGNSKYIFNRIKDIYLNDKKIVIELGNIITNYINNGDWRATDQNGILASKGRYELKIRVLLNLKFRYASQVSSYNPSLNLLIDKLGFIEFEQKRTTLQRMTKIIESMPEVGRIEVKKKYNGRKIIDAVYKIHPTKDFISMMIENNKVTKRAQNILLDENGKPLIKPIQSDFETNSEFINSKREYDIKKGKSLFNTKYTLFNNR